MSRKAIIIESSNVVGENDLPGARKDAENWNRFLKSDAGGAWENAEIDTLNKPSLYKLQLDITLCAADYLLVVFSGHGFFDQKMRITKIALNDKEKEVSINDLKPKDNKGTLIIDACRGTEGLVESIQDSAYQMQYGRSSTIIKSAYNPSQEHRMYWDEKLRCCSKGVVTMYSCSVGEGADEDPDAGGFYTNALINGARRWERAQSSKDWFSTLEAHNKAKSYMNGSQTPEYTPEHLYFPFAVHI